ncbi:MAG: response regulator [Myxococcales bacterium]|nr:response regulator [Myxococcales bacterium]
MTPTTPPRGIILVVDDEDVVCRAMSRSLKYGLGGAFEIEMARSGPEALEILEILDREGEPLLAVVSDVVMPGMTGDELLLTIHQRWPRMVKMLVTGQADASMVARVQQQTNLAACFGKPWDRSKLLDTLRTEIRTTWGI